MLQVDCDPRELENFAERFKQRRIKLGVTQADVGKLPSPWKQVLFLLSCEEPVK